jgi:peptidoglycan-associated lipoprotein
MTLSSPSRYGYRTGNFLQTALQFWLLGALIVLLAGCGPKKPPLTQTFPGTPPPSPTAAVEAKPSVVQAGQPVTITWSTQNATDVAISPIGAVQANGAQSVTPTESTTYHLTAKGPGGIIETDARVTVTEAGTTTTTTTTADGGDLAGASNRFDVYFDLDDYQIRPDQVATVQNDAQFLKQHAEINIVVEGHCDELGSIEYNLALGDKRATQVKSALEKQGVGSTRMRTISYGKEFPVCTEKAENCWKRNRRAHITPDIQH